jgi:hypothetical protein
MVEYIQTPIPIAVDDDFGIGAGAKDVTAAFKLMAEFREVIDFPVEEDLDSALGIRHGLMAAGKIDD